MHSQFSAKVAKGKNKGKLIGQQLLLYAPVDMTLTQAAHDKIGTDPTYKPEQGR